MEERGEAMFERIYGEHRAGVHAVALAVLRDPALAHDVTQDVFLRLWRTPGCYDPSRGPLAPFLKRMAHNRSLDLLRRAASGARAAERLQALAARAEAPVDVVPAAACERAATSASVRAALRQLPAHQREALALAYFADLPIPQVAARTGIPLGTAKSRVRLALQRLRSEPALAGL